jgi:hypothetical protein
MSQNQSLRAHRQLVLATAIVDPSNNVALGLVHDSGLPLQWGL